MQPPRGTSTPLSGYWRFRKVTTREKYAECVAYPDMWSGPDEAHPIGLPSAERQPHCVHCDARGVRTERAGRRGCGVRGRDAAAPLLAVARGALLVQ